MKTKLPLFATILYLHCVICSISLAQNVGISGSSGATIDASAGLDINFSNKGLLMPRVALSATNITTITSPATGLIIYNTANAGTAPNQVCPGTYQWNGSRWIRWNDGITCGYTALPINCSGGGSTPCSPAGTVTDIDGNIYATVVIGTQTWMAQNLKVSKYNDGTSIHYETDGTNWISETIGARCYYDNDSTVTPNKTVYGTLYNWYAVNTGKLCPTGWHVPSDAEWTTLAGGNSTGTGKLKECGLTHWNVRNIGATNEFCFSALPGGFRHYLTGPGLFYYLNYAGSWWSSTEYYSGVAWYLFLNIDGDVTHNPGYEGFGYSVRCLKN